MKKIYQKNISEVKNAVKRRFDALRDHAKTTAKKPLIYESRCRGFCYFSVQTGFTLIELLVVVLIIGILAAVALPQYRKAVMRSKMAEIFIAAKDLMQAEQLYYLANGSYTTDASELEARYPVHPNISSRMDLKNGYCSVASAIRYKYVYCIIPGYLSFYRYMTSERISCCTYGHHNYIADGLCQTETGTKNWYNGCSEEWPCHCYNSN